MKLFSYIWNTLRFNQRNWKAVFLCVFAATIFWFLNAFNKTYTTNINFPLAFDYDTRNFVPVKALPQQVRINVTGNGWDLFRRSTGVKLPALEIPLERPVETKKIVGSTLPAWFSNQLEGLQINFVLTDTIYVDIEHKDGRWIELTLDTASIDIKKGYGLASKISVMPDSIYIEGPKPLIEDLNEPIKIELPFRSIDEHFMEDVEVKLPSEVIKRNPPTVAVMFNVEKMITVQDSVRLAIINIPSTVWPVMGRKEIPITVAIPQNIFEQFALDSARAVLDLKDFNRGERMMLPKIVGLPPFSRIVKVDSVRVEF